MNEEFQSTNEELETSREELQSLNEELTTGNSQLQESLEQQRNTSNDLQEHSEQLGYRDGISRPGSQRSVFFTPAAATLFNLIATDIGRPLTDLAIRFTGVDLLADARTVLDRLTPIKREVKSESGTGISAASLPTGPRTTGSKGLSSISPISRTCGRARQSFVWHTPIPKRSSIHS